LPLSTRSVSPAASRTQSISSIRRCGKAVSASLHERNLLEDLRQPSQGQQRRHIDDLRR
jgi:hypothetical protein